MNLRLNWFETRPTVPVPQNGSKTISFFLLEYSKIFLERDYLLEGQTVDQRVDISKRQVWDYNNVQ